MNPHRLILPLLIYVPANWKLNQSASIYTPDMKALGRIEHGRRTLKEIFNHPVFTVDVATLYHAGYNEPVYSITLPPSLSFEINNSNGDFQGIIQPKTFSIMPEFEFIDHCETRIGTIKPGLQSVIIIEGDRRINGNYSKTRSKGLSPKQHVWEYNSESATDVDSRLILGHVCLPLAPDMSAG